MVASFNSSILPVPSLASFAATNSQDLSNELCSDLDTSLIDDTAKALNHLSNVAIELMFFVLILVWAALCVWQWKRWRALKQIVDEMEKEWQREGIRDAWTTVAIVEHPVLERYGNSVLERVVPAQEIRRNLRWLCK